MMHGVHGRGLNPQFEGRQGPETPSKRIFCMPVPDVEEFEIDLDAVEWTRKTIQNEADRLKDAGLKPIVLEAKNFGIINTDFATHGSVINRIELNTGFNFKDRVKQIMISPAQVYPLKADMMYCHVILLTDNNDIPLLVPYIYSSLSGNKNELKEWLFINNKGARARHSILQYHNV